VKGHPTNWFDHHQGEGFDVLGSIFIAIPAASMAPSWAARLTAMARFRP
jgi:hypothetical protein